MLVNNKRLFLAKLLVNISHTEKPVCRTTEKAQQYRIENNNNNFLNYFKLTSAQYRDYKSRYERIITSYYRGRIELYGSHARRTSGPTFRFNPFTVIPELTRHALTIVQRDPRVNSLEDLLSCYNSTLSNLLNIHAPLITKQSS